MPGEKKKIILVENDGFLSEIYSTKLASSGFNVEVAQDGEDGLAKIKKFMPDLVLLGIVLSKMDGFEVLQKIKNDEALKNTTVVILTNLGQKEEVERGLNLGAKDYIIKAHFTPTEVVAKVKRLLGI